MQAAGGVLRIAGAITGGFAADARRRRYEDMIKSLNQPNATVEEGNWLNDMNKYYGQANTLANTASAAEMDQKLKLREQALPGIGDALRGELGAVAPMARGEFAPWMQRVFSTSAGASTVGTGFGGTGFGAMNTGFGGVDRALRVQQQGASLLQTLLGSIPSISSPTAMGLLQNNILSPTQRINLLFQLNNQKIGVTNTLESLPTALDSWSSHLNESGAMLMGGGGAGFGGLGGMSGGKGGTQPGQNPESGTWENNYGGFNAIGTSEGAGMGSGEGGF